MPDTVRLTDSGKSYEGIVEIYYQGKWTTICDESWDNVGAAVVCRQLEYDTRFGLTEASIDHYNKRSVFNTIVNISCTGEEDNLQECRFKFVENAVNFHCNFIAKVKCSTGRYEKRMLFENENSIFRLPM